MKRFMFLLLGHPIGTAALAAVFCIVASAAAIAQTSAATPSEAQAGSSAPTSPTDSIAPKSPTAPTDGLELLKQVSKKYADAKSFYVEMVEERTTKNEYRNDWERQVMIAAEAPGNRSYYEGRSAMGSARRASDGQTVWTYHLEGNRYTSKPREAKPEAGRPMPWTEIAMSQAKGLRKMLGGMADRFKSGERLPDESLKVDGRRIRCHVVRLRSSDEKREPGHFTFERTLWIDKEKLEIRKMVERSRTMIGVGAAVGVPIDTESVTTFAATELDGTPREKLFHFVPPQDALLIDEFPDPTKALGGNSLLGELAPAWKLTSADGSVVTMDSFRGKPLVIEVWATWCGPCVKGMPKLQQFYEEVTKNGVSAITVDLDVEAKTASDFLSKGGYKLANFHDDGEIEKRLAGPIPRVMVVDSMGKIVYDVIGMQENDVRSEIAKLGPRYAALAPKTDDGPCPASQALHVEDRDPKSETGAALTKK